MKNKKKETLIYNNGQYEKEVICAENWMRLIYENPVGSATLPFFVKRKIFSRIYGMYCKTPFSARNISQFIEQYQVDMTGCEEVYKNYAAFFTREKKGIIFPKEANALGAPCEGLASVYDNIDPKNLINIKSAALSLSELFDDEILAKEYSGGTMLTIRLTPTNYHRVHSFDDGVVSSSKFINGHLFSVSPLALRRIAQLYCRNKRALVQFSSQNFGDVVLVEVGATFVGSIIHCFNDSESVKRADQISYFEPGGSLLLVFFKKGFFTPKGSLLEQTDLGFETKVNIGEILGYGDQVQ